MTRALVAAVAGCVAIVALVPPPIVALLQVGLTAVGITLVVLEARS